MCFAVSRLPAVWDGWGFGMVLLIWDRGVSSSRGFCLWSGRGTRQGDRHKGRSGGEDRDGESKDRDRGQKQTREGCKTLAARLSYFVFRV